MKFLKESKDKYYAVNQDCAGYYETIDEVKRDLINFVPYGQDALSEDEKIVVYKLNGQDESDLGFDDIVFEFYDNKIHYFHTGRVVNYVIPKPKEEKIFRLLGSDNKYYNVTAYTKSQAQKMLKDYLRGK